MPVTLPHSQNTEQDCEESPPLAADITPCISKLFEHHDIMTNIPAYSQNTEYSVINLVLYQTEL